MAVSYNKLWKLLVDKKMSKHDLVLATGMSPNTMTKMRRDEPVMLIVLDKICKTLDANYGDIILRRCICVWKFDCIKSSYRC